MAAPGALLPEFLLLLRGFASSALTWQGWGVIWFHFCIRKGFFLISSRGSIQRGTPSPPWLPSLGRGWGEMGIFGIFQEIGVGATRGFIPPPILGMGSVKSWQEEGGRFWSPSWGGWTLRSPLGLGRLWECRGIRNAPSRISSHPGLFWGFFSDPFPGFLWPQVCPNLPDPPTSHSRQELWTTPSGPPPSPIT